LPEKPALPKGGPLRKKGWGGKRTGGKGEKRSPLSEKRPPPRQKKKKKIVPLSEGPRIFGKMSTGRREEREGKTVLTKKKTNQRQKGSSGKMGTHSNQGTFGEKERGLLKGGRWLKKEINPRGKRKDRKCRSPGKKSPGKRRKKKGSIVKKKHSGRDEGRAGWQSSKGVLFGKRS